MVCVYMCACACACVVEGKGCVVALGGGVKSLWPACGHVPLLRRGYCCACPTPHPHTHNAPPLSVTLGGDLLCPCVGRWTAPWWRHWPWVPCPGGLGSAQRTCGTLGCWARGPSSWLPCTTTPYPWDPVLVRACVYLCVRVRVCIFMCVWGGGGYHTRSHAPPHRIPPDPVLAPCVCVCVWGEGGGG